MTKEEFVNICVAEGLSKREAEWGWEHKPPDFDLPSTPANRQIMINLLREMMPDFIWARK